jgi:hypothetical protein
MPRPISEVSTMTRPVPEASTMTSLTWKEPSVTTIAQQEELRKFAEWETRSMKETMMRVNERETFQQDTFPVSSRAFNTFRASDPSARKFGKDQADLDTFSVSTRATSANTFSASASTATTSLEDGVHVTESAEGAEAMKTVKEKRSRRAENPSTKGMPFTQAMYKRRFCCHYPDIDQCKRGKNCAFAHSRAEFRGSLLSAEEEHDGEHSDDFYMYRYKTLWCPIGIPHHWKNCVYGHNHLDIRRSPEIGYGPRQCPHWYNCNDKTPYADRCPNGVRCPYTHGAKEQLYHPAYFKTAVCWDVMSEGGCPRSHFCAFHHTKEECRVEETKEMKYDYTRALSDEEMVALQKDFNMPIPIAADVGALGKTNKEMKKETLPSPQPPPDSPPFSKTATMARLNGAIFSKQENERECRFFGTKPDEVVPPPIPAQFGSAAQHGDGSMMFMPTIFPYPFVMPSQMMNGATPQAPGTKVVMMPVPVPVPREAVRPSGSVDEILGSLDLTAESLTRALRNNPTVGRRSDIMDLRN